MLLPLTIASTLAAAIPAALTVLNLDEYREPPPARHALPAVRIIIPARNEAAAIVSCVQSVLASTGVDLFVEVMDDASTDATAALTAQLAAKDSRLTLTAVETLPAGWNGKQHACWQAARVATEPLLCFIDADVRLAPGALSRMATLLVHGDGRRSAADHLPERAAALVSGFPRQITVTPLEWLLLPMIHFVLLGLLPMRGLRLTTAPSLAAGCGQFLMVDRAAYLRAGGHAAIRSTMHDGLLLPRLLRQNGEATRLADLTALATCRMYTSATSTWRGLRKNATEGLAAPARIVPVTLLLGLGQVLPLPLLVSALLRDHRAVPWAWAAVVLSYLPRLLELRRFQQRMPGALAHPVGVALLLLLQWQSLALKLLRRPASWKSRNYPAQ